MRSNPVVRRGLALLLAISLLMVAAGSAASAAGRHIAVNVSLVPDCFSAIRISADWAANPAQVAISFELTDLSTGGLVQSLGQPIGSASATSAQHDFATIASFSPDIHRFLATVTIQDGSDNQIMRGQKRVRLNCTIAP